MAAGNLDLSIRINADGTAAITGLRRVDDALGDLNQGAQRTSGAVSGLGDSIKGMVAAAAGFIAVDAMISGFTDANVEAGRLRASLETVTGSVRGASDAWDSLSEFAKRTPFDLAQSVEGFIALKARGLDPSIAALESYGNTASAMGKSMNDMIQLVADAAMGQFDRLAEFGIDAAKSGDQVAFTFNKVTTVVKDNAQDIERYLQSIGNTEFADAMTRQMDTLGPAITNVKDAVMAAWVQLGDSGLVSAVVDGLKWIAEWIERISKSMAAGDFAAWVDGLQGIAGAAAGASGVYLALSAAVEAATVAQTAFNLVVSANPYVLAAVAVGALVGGLYALRDTEVEIGRTTYALRDGFQAVWEEVSALATASADAVAEGWFHALSSIAGWFNDLGIDIGAVAVGIGQVFAALWDELKSSFKEGINALVNLFVGLGKTVGTIAAALVTAFSRAFDDIAAIAGAAMSDLGNFDLDFTQTKAAIADGFRAQVENGEQAAQQIGDNFDLSVDRVGQMTAAAVAGVDRVAARAKDISLNRQLDAASAEADALKESTVRATGAARAHAAALGEQAGAADKLTKAQREGNAELEEYARRAGQVLAEQNKHGNLADQAAQARRYAASIGELLPVIDQMGQKYGVSREMILSLMETESRFVKNAKSPAGAMGLMQLMPATATEWAAKLGLVGNAWKTNVNDNIEIGVAYFAWLVQQLGDVNKAIQAYNGGIGNIQKGIVPEETRKYLPQVVGNVQALATVAGKAGEAIRDDLNRPLAEQAQIAGEASQILARLNDTWDSLADRYGTAYAAGRRQEEQLREIAILFKTGRMTADEYNAALADIRREYQAAQGPMGEYLAGLEAGMGSLETLAVDALDGFNNALVEGLVDGRFEFDDFVDDIKRTLAKMAVDTIVLKFAGQITGIFGGASGGNVALDAAAKAAGVDTGSLSGLSSLSSAYKGYQWLQGGGSLTSAGMSYNTGFMSQQSQMLAAQESGMGLSGSSGGTYLNAGAGLVGGMAGSYIAGQMFDGKYVQTGSSVGGMGGAYLGATYGSAFGLIGTAAGALIGAIAGGALASLFGDDVPRQGHYATSYSGSGLEDGVSATGAFGLKFGLSDKGSSNIKASEYRSSFNAMADVSNQIAAFYGPELSAKIQTSMQATIPSLNQWGKDLTTAFDSIFSGILWHADVVEGATGDGLGHLLRVATGDLTGSVEDMANQLSAGMQIVNTVTALYGTEIGKLMGMASGDEFGSLEASIGAMKAYLASFARGGETAAMTTQRLVVGIAAFSQALTMTGVNLDAVTKSGFDFVWMAQRFPDALAYFGFTLDSLTQTQATYYAHFWTEEERATQARDASLASIAAWSASIGKTGDATIDTGAKFRAYIESLRAGDGLLSVATQDAYLRAMQMVPAFVALDEALATLTGTAAGARASVSELIASLQPNAVAESAALAEMTGLFAEWGMRLPATSAALYALIQAGALPEAQMQTLADRSETLGQAFAGLADRQKTALDLLTDTYSNRVSAENTLSQGRIDTLNADYETLIAGIDSQYNLTVEDLNAQLDTTRDSLGDLETGFSDLSRIVDSATDALRSLADQGDGIDETRQRLLQEARAALAQYAATQTFPDTLDATIGGLDTVDPNDFATRDDWLAAIDENAAVLTQLQALSSTGKTDAQVQIDLANAQVELLERQIKEADSARVEALKAAKANLDTAIRAEKSALEALLNGIGRQYEDAKATLMSDTNIILETGNTTLAAILAALQANGATGGFDETAYLAQNPDVAAAVASGSQASGLSHYLNHGASEGRAPTSSAAQTFNELAYLQRYPDVAAEVAKGTWLDSGWQHYLLYGINEGRIPGFAAGGISTGPTSGYPVTLHGTEAVIPLASGSVPVTIRRDALADEIRALRAEVQSLKSAQTATATSAAEQTAILRRWNGDGLPPDRMDYAKTVAESTAP
ncbi:transglycosylase SLT domain-containing protein [Thiocystis violascens]|uniref:Soluble lytic murein transglycosylase-like protein n=1 Tax=Thiocystis violascens (strain ATCC 17096 / DSM 198 / 6111) TaxID=765911 RepID=I3YEJ1_THIV6|nr:transglycosylase SLT domain-containing protein [Thiocystis violascens]AFL75409.1 soluble lytic murein transglycosylase-like protein [Thiocystis violascens DSM 198]